jgi:hypothetical protein
MGCDIHSFAEKRNKKTGKWEVVANHFALDSFDQEYYNKEKGDSPFNWRSYSMFAFLAGVRNYDHCEPLSEPKGLPDDSEYLNEVEEDWMGYKETKKQSIELNGNYHSLSYLTLKELNDFDYDKTFWSRRIYRETYNPDGTVSGGNGAALAEEGEGKIITYRENLGEFFFIHLEELKQLGEPEDVRVVFWFDN